MAVLKCKMCGANLSLPESGTVTQCEYCGSVQTVPSADNDKMLNLFSRANRLRANCEFDKAAGVYESIVADFPEEAEAYWGLVLCKFGIEYVDDPTTGKKIPTCHRSSFDSVMEDPDLEQALENADAVARKVYREEAKQIEELRKGIIETSSSEQPYDIFICYKETNADNQRTLDSVLAQDLYETLTGKGYRVFFARITLEDKLGQAYEPCIFAALNSARVMLAIGTDYEHYQAVWVKNEWGRYLKLMEKDKSKHLIPCYKDIDAYDLPKEFAKLQAQDLGKVGADQDLLRGIEKLFPEKASKPAERVIFQQAAAPSVSSFLRRGQLFLGDGEWKEAGTYFDKVLDIQPEHAEAYLGKLMIDYCVEKKEDLRSLKKSFERNPNYQKAMKFGDEEMRNFLSAALIAAQKNQERIKQEHLAALERQRQEQEEQKRQKAEAEEQKRLQALAYQKFVRRCRRHNRWLIFLLWVANIALMAVIWALVTAIDTPANATIVQEAYYTAGTGTVLGVTQGQLIDVWSLVPVAEMLVELFGFPIIIFSASAIKNKLYSVRESRGYAITSIILCMIAALAMAAAFQTGIRNYDFGSVLRTLPANLVNIGTSGYLVYGITAVFFLSIIRLLLNIVLPFCAKKRP